MPLPCPSPDDGPSDSKQIRDALTQLAAGKASVEDVLSDILGNSPPAPALFETAQSKIDGATVDLGREQRCGFGEVIYGQGKEPALIARIAQTQLKAGQNVLVTRIEPDAATEVMSLFQNTQHNSVARTLRISQESVAPFQSLSPQRAAQTTHAAVVTAGSTDRPVAEEALETLTWMGVPFQFFEDVGVAGPQRLASALPSLKQASVVVVVAGMEGALPSVVAGHLGVPIFAVPTSVGYGTTMGGLTPLFGMLSGCSANVSVVNIDAGFKGGYLAGLITDQLRRA